MDTFMAEAQKESCWAEPYQERILSAKTSARLKDP